MNASARSFSQTSREYTLKFCGNCAQVEFTPTKKCLLNQGGQRSQPRHHSGKLDTPLYEAGGFGVRVAHYIEGIQQFLASTAVALIGGMIGNVFGYLHT